MNEPSTRRQLLGRFLGASLTLPLFSRIANATAGEKAGRFAGKAVLITGATSGIGEATAKAFAKEGARVFFCGLNKDRGRDVVAKIKAEGGEAQFFKADVRNEDEVKSFVDACVKAYGRVDVAFNNAGVGYSEFMAPLEVSSDSFGETFRTNVDGVFLSMKYEALAMRKQASGGVILNMASVYGHKVSAYQGPYSASKAAVLSLTVSAAAVYAKDKIRVNSISPGAVATEKVKKLIQEKGFDLVKHPPHNALERLLTVKEVVDAVLLVSSEQSGFMYGADIDLSMGEKNLV